MSEKVDDCYSGTVHAACRAVERWFSRQPPLLRCRKRSRGSMSPVQKRRALRRGSRLLHSQIRVKRKLGFVVRTPESYRRDWRSGCNIPPLAPRNYRLASIHRRGCSAWLAQRALPCSCHLPLASPSGELVDGKYPMRLGKLGHPSPAVPARRAALFHNAEFLSPDNPETRNVRRY